MKGKEVVFVFMLLLLLVACGTATGLSNADEEAPGGASAQEAGATVETATTAAAGETTGDEEAVSRPAGWTEASHGNDAAPNYEVVFPQDKVNEITITIDPQDWQAMQENMTALFGEAGTGAGAGGGRGGPGEGFGPPAAGERPEDFAPRQDFVPPGDGQLPDAAAPPQGDGFPGGGGPGFGGGDFTTENPMWVAATITFEGQTWRNVGVRYKGNSSLQSAWRSGDSKLPLKLDFDEFEDEYPEIENQRFYGFKQLSLANGFGDDTYMRDTITYDLLQEAGLPAAETAYYEVFLDYGEGAVSLGLYTVVEVIDDTVIDRFFGDDDGNIYEGDGRAASLAEGTFDQIESSFQKENNKKEADYSDLEALYNVLHAEQRSSDPAAWRASLESIFDVETFLTWLALSAVLEHWDTYGSMTHNYYLYHDPESGRLTWISWDHNLVLGGSPNGGGGGGQMGGRNNVSLDRAEVGEKWPLIRFLLDDPVYEEAYAGYVAEMVTLFNPEKMTARYQALAALIAPYVTAEEGGASFADAVAQLIAVTNERYEAAVAFISSGQ